jgi:hypothetical protein
MPAVLGWGRDGHLCIVDCQIGRMIAVVLHAIRFIDGQIWRDEELDR